MSPHLLTSRQAKHKTRIVPVTPADLLKEYESGMSTGDLARKYQVSRQRVHQLLQRTGEAFKQATDKHLRFKRNYEAFVALVKKYGYIPSIQELRPYSTCVCLHYYEFRKLALAEGYVYKKLKRAKPDNSAKKDALILHLKQLAEQLGRTPTKLEIDAANKFTSNQYYSNFGSLRQAQQLAGLKPNPIGHQHNRPKRPRSVSKQPVL